MNKYLKATLNLLLPKICYACETISDNPLCKDCQKSFSLNLIEHATESTLIKKRFSLISYKNIPLKKLLHFLKFEQHIHLSKFISEEIKKINLPKSDVYLTVPSDPKKLRIRGFNQVDLIFKPILKLKTPILRTKKTPSLYAYSPEERKKIMKNAFKWKSDYEKKIIANKNITILDDIYTTGATTNEIAKEIKKANPKSITVLTLSSV